MLCIFVDPPESDTPDLAAPATVAFSPDADPDAVARAETIVFPPGYHNLRRARPGGIIDGDGLLTLGEGQALYLAGGAFVEGLVHTGDGGYRGQRIYGRGILTGRQYLWRRHPDHTGPEYRHILGVGNEARVEGIIVMESPNHGIVGRTARIENVKFLGWHCNNDAVRVGSGSEIRNSFFRAVDDHFYNFNIRVRDVVLWAGHNGAILTYGWGGKNTYNSGASLLENIDIIHPEWTGLGNNNGLVAAQVGFDYRPFGYGGETTTVLRNIRIEGTIPGLVNLKPLSSGRGDVTAEKVPADRVGYLGDLVFESIRVDGAAGKSRIRGTLAAATDGTKPFEIRNVTFRDVRIGDTTLSDANRGLFLDEDPVTTRNIRIETTR